MNLNVQYLKFKIKINIISYKNNIKIIKKIHRYFYILYNNV